MLVRVQILSSECMMCLYTLLMMRDAIKLEMDVPFNLVLTVKIVYLAKPV